MQTIEVISIEDAGFYSSEHMSGSTVKVTLQRGTQFVSCDGILIWEEEYLCDDMFDEWRQYAAAGEEGYKYWTE